MMSRSLTQVRPDAGQIGPGAGQGGITPARSGELRPRETGGDTLGTRALASYGEHMMAVSVWRQGAPRASFRQRVQTWRARNWRRAVLTWFVASLAIMAIAAEPSTDFPKAQAHSVPAVRVVVRVVEILTLGGAPVLLIALP